MEAVAHVFADDGDVPNHPRYPLIVYGGVFAAADGDLASAFEERFHRHGWGRSWRNGIFAFHHFHASAHEVLGIASGTARVRFGGEGGATLDVAAGDAVLIPAGVGHKRLSADADLLVVGAYPPGVPVDLLRDATADPEGIRRRIAGVAKPALDPVAGGDGPMMRLWQD